MPRLSRLRYLIGFIAFSTCLTERAVPAQNRETPSTSPRPQTSRDVIPIFLTPPLSLDDFWRKLDSPDFVLISGSTYKAMTAEARGKGDASSNAVAVVGSVAVTGRVSGDLARLSIRFGLTSNAIVPTWVPIALDGVSAIASARESNADLPIRAGSKGGWEIEISQAGKHEVVVEAVARVSQTGDERRLLLPIPVCSSTLLDLEIEQRIAEAVIGEREVASVTPSLDGERTRITAALTPRDRVVVNWRTESGNLQLPELLGVQGELSIDVDPDWVRTRSNWNVSATRGLAKTIVVGFDSDEEILDVELDGRTIPNDVTRDTKASKLIINLSEPIRLGTSRRLTISSRRKLQRGQTNRVTIRGYPFDKSQVQTGAISVTKAKPVFVDGLVGRSLRRVDPRDELPDDLRAKPGIVLAYQFADQPFELTLLVDPSPPRVRVEPRTTLTVNEDRVNIDTWLEYNNTKGQIYELHVDLAEGVELEEWGPEELIAGAEWAKDGADTADKPAGRRLILHLSPAARDRGGFRIHLSARQAIGNASSTAIALPVPRGETPLGGLVALTSSPGVDVRKSGQSWGDGFEELALPASPNGWNWPVELKPEAKSAVIWLRQTATASKLPLAIAREKRILTQQNSLMVEVRRDALEVEQELSVGIPFGSLLKLDLSVPPEILAWSVELPTIVGNDLLATEPDGRRRYRLTLDREYEDSARFRFRYELPLNFVDRVATLPLSSIRSLDVQTTDEVVRVVVRPGVEVDVKSPGWAAQTSEEGLEGRSRERYRLVREKSTASDPVLIVRSDTLLTLPELVASRLLLRSSVSSSGEFHTMARYLIESHGASIDLELPNQGQWIRAEVNDQPVREIEARPEANRYRILLPEGLQSGPFYLSLEYRHALPSSVRDFVPIKLVNGLVQFTYWDVALPWNQMILGVPRGWNEENRWSWKTYALRRSPLLSTSELANWVGGSAGRSRPPEQIAAGEDSEHHRFLFSKVGEPAPLSARVISKGLLLLICTGVVSLVGVLTVLLRLGAVVLLVGSVGLALTLTAVWDGTLVIGLLQSSVFGIFLTISALILQWIVDRRRGGVARPLPERVGSTLTRRPAGSTVDSPAVNVVGSDDSTMIRRKPSTGSAQIIITPPVGGVSMEDSTTTSPPREQPL